MTTSSVLSQHYLTGPYREFEQEHRAGGTFGIEMLQVDQKAIEAVDPPASEIAVVSSVTKFEGFESDFGDGWQKTEYRGTRHIDIQPANTECAFRVPDIGLLIAVVSVKSITSLLDQHALSAGALDAAVQKFQYLPRAISTLDTMWRIAKRSDPASQIELDGAFLTLIGELLHACGHGLGRMPALGDQRLSRAIEYAETHIAAPLTVGELAAAAAMSPSAFSRAFRAATGETPWAYVRRRRLERAGELLSRTDDTLMDIAAACGFADASHLTRAWKQRYGTTPRGNA